ncbi:hypothetical protein [Helicobacter monodelphidis]|uniref:hypothetical protein n=1 Tax=Helicobacter sp. 15-1451 TaxID=2004995 RepID=UPI001C6783F0|nr:hypothetical protein [Helicobacter sp. 15-1451]
MYAYEHAFSDYEVIDKKHNFGLWAVILKEDNTFIVQAGLTIQDIVNNELLEIGFHSTKNIGIMDMQ